MLQSKSDNKPEEYERICLTGTPLEPTYLGADPPTVPTSTDALGGALALGSANPLYEDSAKPSLIQRMQEQHRQELQQLRQELEAEGQRQLAQAAAGHAEALAAAVARHQRALQEVSANTKTLQQQLQTVENLARQREESLKAEVAQLHARLQALTAELRKVRHAGKEQQAQQSWGRDNLTVSSGPSRRNSQAGSQGWGRSPQVRKGSGSNQEQARLQSESAIQRSNSTAASRPPLQASN
ncbi:hypothetical protein N2152v2_001713 [Parachlorella kessleri]